MRKGLMDFGKHSLVDKQTFALLTVTDTRNEANTAQTKFKNV